MKQHSSQSSARTVRPYNAPGGEEVRVALLDNRGMDARPDLGKSGFAPDRAEGDGNALPEHSAWSPLFSFLMEGFALWGAALHPTAAFPVEAYLAQEETLQQSGFSLRGRRGFISPVSRSASPGWTVIEQKPTTDRLSEDDGLIEFDRVAVPDAASSERWNWLTSSWEAIVTLWSHWRREREIERAVAALAELDDRTLQNMGIPDRSQIEQTVRYCHDC